MKRNRKKPRPTTSSLAAIAAAASGLPDDLLELGILPHLPAKALMRFKCVSKKWHRMISSPSPLFVRLQLQCAASGLAPRHLFSPPFPCISKHLRSIGIPSSSNLLERLLESPYHVVVASCNGFVCCIEDYHNPHKIVIGNPSLNDWKLLPPKPSLNYVGNIAYGMAVDVGEFPVRYRLVLLNRTRLWYNDVYEVHVLSSTTQRWSVINEVISLPSGGRIDKDEVAVYADGTLYWSSLDLDCRVLWFNVENKLYGFHKLPLGANLPEHGHIGECGGKLSYAMVCGWEIQMWSLDRQNWCQRLSIPLDIILGRRLKGLRALCLDLQLRKKRQSNNTPAEVRQTFTMLPFEGGDSLSFCLDEVIYTCDTVTGLTFRQDKKGNYMNFFPYRNNTVSLPREEKEKDEAGTTQK